MVSTVCSELDDKKLKRSSIMGLFNRNGGGGGGGGEEHTHKEHTHS